MADNLDTPYSRREIFYKGILDQDPDSLPDPETREERYLKAIAEAYPTPVEATVTQDEGSSTTSVMSQKAVTDALDGLRDSKLDKTGTAHLADNLTPYSADSGATQSVPFINQGTGCGNGESVVDTGSYAQVKKKLGNTVAVNQLVDAATTSVTVPSGHKYYAVINGTASIGTSNGTAIAVTGGQDIVIDLSLWYGSTDRIPSDLLAHPENWGRYYSGSLAYNPGQLVNADGSVLTSIGRNIWDEEWEVGAYNTIGNKQSDSTRIRSKNFIPVIPNNTYAHTVGMYVFEYDENKTFISRTEWVSNRTFTTRPNTKYINFHCYSSYGAVYKNNITISLYYSGESGYDQYYPYIVLARIDTGSEVLRSAGAVADDKTPDGTITRNGGEPVTLDLSTMTFTQEVGGETRQWYSNDQPFASYKKPATNADKANAQSSRLPTYSYTDLRYASGGFAITSTGRLAISNDVYTNRASYGSITFYCEAATPTTEQGTAFAENIPCDDFGSMYWTQTNGVPQGVEIFYPVDYKASLDTLLNMVDGDVEKLVTETELGAVADRIPEAPAEDGTYTLKATVADGVKTYAWVADE